MSAGRFVALGAALALGACAATAPAPRQESVMKQIAPYGTWESPLAAAAVAAGSLVLDEPRSDGRDLYWIEGRPQEQGRQVVVRWRDGTAQDVTPSGFNVRSRVHQYGGGAYLVHEGTVYFSNFADNRLYRQAPGAAPAALTRSSDTYHADCAIDPSRRRLLCVREDHRAAGKEAVNTLVAVPLDGAGEARVLVSGADFYSNPRLSPDGRRLAWLSWKHPDMPWDATELWVAALDADGRPQAPRRVAGGARESVFQPEWSPDGVLHFVSDRSGWWNLYRDEPAGPRALRAMEAEFAHPQWVFGQSTYGFDGQGRIVCAWTQAGRWHLARLDPASGAFEPIATRVEPEDSLSVAGDVVLFVGGAADAPRSVVRLDLARGDEQVLKRAFSSELAADDVSRAEAIEFVNERQQTVHAWYYAPRNARFRGSANDSPPLIVISHGGPTSAASATLSLKLQYWTTRGFAVVDVNYGGSTGYGRAYRERLNGNWGIVDVEDCIAAAGALVRAGKADPSRLLIRGGSAGGYTTLAALTFHDVFRAGASYFGVSDAEALARDTHKFESRYLDRLIGPYPAQRALYVERSPIQHVERLSTPLILFQGLDDKVVPPAQSERMAEVLRRKGVPVAYVAFEGEGHGFRRAENIVRALESELYFYGAILGFTPAGRLPEVPIENLTAVASR